MKTIPTPPSDLSPVAAQLWEKAHEVKDLNDVQRAMLRSALLALDLAERLTTEMAGQPSTFQTKYWGMRMNPLLRAEQKARRTFLDTLNRLRLTALTSAEPAETA